jgi:hypothetical protein
MNMATREDAKLLRDILCGIGGVLCLLLVACICGGFIAWGDLLVLKKEVILMRSDVKDFNCELKGMSEKVQQLWFMHQKVAILKNTSNIKQDDIH